MLPGLSTYSFPWAIGLQGYQPPKPLTAFDLLEVAAAYAISYVQYGDNLPLHTLSTEQLSQLKEQAFQLQIRIQVGTRRLTHTSIQAYLSIAQTFQSPFLRVVIDDADFHPDEKEVIDVIKKLLPDIKEAGVPLAIENHDRFPAASLERVIQQTDPEWVGICLDTANSLGAGEGIGEVVAVLAPYTLNVHIKDFRIKRVHHKMGFTVAGCAAGDGMLDIPWLVKEVKKHNKCTTATLEVWSNPEPTVDETIAKEKQWVEKSIHYLKQILA